MCMSDPFNYARDKIKGELDPRDPFGRLQKKVSLDAGHFSGETELNEHYAREEKRTRQQKTILTQQPTRGTILTQQPAPSPLVSARY